MNKSLIFGVTILGLALVPAAWSEARWYKGATHVHSLWSDGNGSPEIIADWYKKHGWDFMCFSDHNTLLEGEKYVSIDPEGHLTPARFDALQSQFGEDWTVTREAGGKRQMRLKTLEEIIAHFAEAGKFLLFPAKEMTSHGGNPHMNVLNVREVVPGAPKGGGMTPKMQGYIDTIEAQKAKHKVPMLVHLDHPNYHDRVTTEEMIAVRGLRFFEVFNGIGHYGDPAQGV
ncbi:MAG: histidinol-phosphatase, partial [Candidatus Hydrogenedentes bacterium]|nr:histidinol-phosphatase [Candidatus Hydrogenedentota bacterium]